MKFSDNFFNKVEKKTNVNKETILNLAKKLQQNDMKNEGTLREVINELSKMTGREVSKEKEDKIVEAVISDKIPKDKFMCNKKWYQVLRWSSSDNGRYPFQLLCIS